MENEQNQQPTSGSTSPTDLHSVTSEEGITDDSVTVISSNDAESVSTIQSFNHPAPPVNTPATQSLAGDLATMDLAAANEKLEGVPGGATPPMSVSDDSEGKAQLRARVRSDVPLLKQLFKAPPKKSVKKKGKVTKERLDTPKLATRGGDISPPDEHVHEQNTWHAVAIEDVTLGLKRLAMAAKDAHKIDNSKTVEQYYSEDLASVIKNADVKFNSIYLQ